MSHLNSDDNDGCAGLGCTWVLAMIGALIVGSLGDWHMREVVVVSLGMTFALCLGWIIADAIKYVWEGWRSRR